MNDLAYQFDNPYEILDGKMYMMASPSLNHTRIVMNIAQIFSAYLRGKPCSVFIDSVDVNFNENNMAIPDLTIVCDKTKLKPDGIYGAPDLIVEVLSPSTAKNDKGYKKDLYEEHGVKEYWIIDPDAKSIDVYLLRDGTYELDDAYIYRSAEEREYMTKKDRNSLIYEFQTRINNDNLAIKLEEVFFGLI